MRYRVGLSSRIGVGDAPLSAFGANLAYCPSAVTTQNAATGQCSPNAAGLFRAAPVAASANLIAWFATQVQNQASSYASFANGSQSWFLPLVAAAAANWYVFSYPAAANLIAPLGLDSGTITNQYIAPAALWANTYGSANALTTTWSVVPWGAIPGPIWTWLNQYGPQLAQSTALGPLGALSPVAFNPTNCVDWASQDFTTASAPLLTIQNQYNIALSGRPGDLPCTIAQASGSQIPWSVIPWAVVPWATIQLGAPPAGMDVGAYFVQQVQAARANQPPPPSGSPEPPAAPSLLTQAVNCAAAGGAWNQTTSLCACPPGQGWNATKGLCVPLAPNQAPSSSTATASTSSAGLLVALGAGAALLFLLAE
jgi:hypothetical protein